MWQELLTMFQAPVGVWEAVVRILSALAASAIAYLMYQLFYGSRHIGAGVHRTFLIGGPAIALIFLVIQSSIPLGIGLLGALSFVRFRTPIKDPAEIGFLLLLIASAIGTATGNLIPVAILFAVVFVALSLHRLITNKVSMFGRGHLMISVDQFSFYSVENNLNTFLKARLRGLSLETMSTIDDRINLHYQYQKRSDMDWTGFAKDLDQLAGTAKVEIFVG
jgi:hypothetical protein